MKFKTISIILIISLFITLCGCKTENETDIKETIAESSSVSAPETDESETQKKESAVFADYSENSAAYSDYITFNADESEYATKIMFTAEGDVRDFSFLSLTYKDIDTDGNMVFDTETLYSLDTLEETKPLEVTMTFYGDIPSYGITYTDAQGTIKSYAITQSGEDGSVILSEF